VKTVTTKRRMGQRPIVAAMDRLFAGMTPAGRRLAILILGFAALGGLASGLAVRHVSTWRVPTSPTAVKSVARQRQGTVVPLPSPSPTIAPGKIYIGGMTIDPQVSPGGMLHVSVQVVLKSDQRTPVPDIPCVLDFPAYNGSPSLLPLKQQAHTDGNGRCSFVVVLPNNVKSGLYYARVWANWKTPEGTYPYEYTYSFTVGPGD